MKSLSAGRTENATNLFFLSSNMSSPQTATAHENYNLYLNLLCRLSRLGQLSQWPVVNQPARRAQRAQRTQRAQRAQRAQRTHLVTLVPKNLLQFNGFNHTLNVFILRVIR